MKRIFNSLEVPDLTRGSITKNILKLATPLWLGSCLYFILWFLNMFWVSRLGPEAIAAVTIGGTGLMLMMTPIQGIVTATYGLIGSLTGKQYFKALNKLAKQMLVITGFVSVGLAFFGCLAAPWLFSLLGTEPDVISLAVTYLRIQLIGGIITFFLWVINGMIRSTGNVTLPLMLISLTIILQAIFDPLFILGFGPVPQMGVTGAALSSVLSALAGTFVAFWVLLSGKTLIKIDLKNFIDFKPTVKTLKEVAVISVPDTFEGGLRLTTSMVMLWVVGFYGVVALAAYGIGTRLLLISSVWGFDLAAAAAIILANNLGAGNTKRAEKSAWRGCLFNLIIMGAAACLLFIYAEQLVGIFTQETEVLRIGVSYFRLTTFGYAFLAAAIVIRRVFGGAKDSLTPMLVNCFAFILLQLPLALVLPSWLGNGIEGVWLAILFANVCYGLIMVALFRIGYWKKKFRQ